MNVVVTTWVDECKRADESEICHIVCCCTNDNIGVCGQDVTGWPWSDSDDDLECVVCDDLWPEGAPCPLCGCEEC